MFLKDKNHDCLLFLQSLVLLSGITDFDTVDNYFNLLIPFYIVKDNTLELYIMLLSGLNTDLAELKGLYNNKSSYFNIFFYKKRNYKWIIYSFEIDSSSIRIVVLNHYESIIVAPNDTGISVILSRGGNEQRLRMTIKEILSYFFLNQYRKQYWYRSKSGVIHLWQ